MRGAKGSSGAGGKNMEFVAIAPGVDRLIPVAKLPADAKRSFSTFAEAKAFACAEAKKRNRSVRIARVR